MSFTHLNSAALGAILGLLVLSSPSTPTPQRAGPRRRRGGLPVSGGGRRPWLDDSARDLEHDGCGVATFGRPVKEFPRPHRDHLCGTDPRNARVLLRRAESTQPESDVQ